MSNLSVSHFYSADHDRLDEIFRRFQKLKSSDLGKAKESFAAFKSGLEQHMAWEEAILFSVYEGKKGEDPEGPTVELRLDHEQIRDRLEAIEEKLRRDDSGTQREEAALLKKLKAHNEEEEESFYGALDNLLTPDETDDIFKNMKSSAW